MTKDHQTKEQKAGVHLHSVKEREKLLETLQELVSFVESQWDYSSIRYGTVMTDQEWEEFSSHPERKPYTTDILKKTDDFSKNFAYIVKVLKDSLEIYSTLPNKSKDKAYKDKLKFAISTLLDCVISARYSMEFMRFGDILAGRSKEDRDTGNVNPTEVTKSLFEFAIREHAYLTNKNPEELMQKYLKICDGRLSILSDYYSSCQMDLKEREELRDIFGILGRDYTMSFFELRVGWEIWKIYRHIGLDLDKFLSFIDLPNYATVEKKLIKFLKNKELSAEIIEHMRDEFPATYKNYIKKGSVERYELTHEEAIRKNYPKTLRHQEEIQKMIGESQKEVLELFPLAKKRSPRNLILNPTHPASTRRAFQSSTKNVNGDRVNVIVMTPLSDMKDEYLPTLAHETGHALHRIILEMGEKNKVLEKGATERVPSSVMEEFSQLVEIPFHKKVKLPFEKNYSGKEFPNFRAGLTTRFQAPYALVQLGIRKEFDQMWNARERGILTHRKSWELKSKFDAKAKKWLEEGLPIDFGFVDSLGLFSAESPDDGLVYIKRYVVEDTKKEEAVDTQQETQDMQSAFIKRFGKDWVKSKDARTIMLWLLLESGRNYKTETFHKIIAEKDIKECLEELYVIGLKESEI